MLLLEHNFSHNAVVLKVMFKSIMYKFLRIMNLTLGCEFTKPTKSRAHLSLRQVRFESGAPFTGVSLANYRTVLGSLSRSNIVTFQLFHRTSIFSFMLGIGKRANQNKESGGLMTTGAKGWARRSNSLGKKGKESQWKKKEPKKKTLRSSLVTILFVYFILFFFSFWKTAIILRSNETCQFYLSFCVV